MYVIFLSQKHDILACEYLVSIKGTNYIHTSSHKQFSLLE